MPRECDPVGFVFFSGAMGKFMSIKDIYGQALIAAAMEGNLELIELLLASGASVNGQNHTIESEREDSGSTALIIAVRYGYKKCVEASLRLGADVNKVHSNYSTALMVACEKGSTDTVRLLIESGADVNAIDNFGEAAFIRGARMGSLLTLKLLLESGADLDVISNGDGTTLINAAAYHNHDVINTLIDVGVDVNQCNFSSDTPLVDPVHLFLSLSSETEFRRKPLPIALSAVACMNINLL